MFRAAVALGKPHTSRYKQARAICERHPLTSMLNVILDPLQWLINALLDLCWFVVIAAVVASWLIAFGVLNMTNPTVRQIVRALDGLTEPVFRQVRRVIPPIGGLDLSPVFVLLGITVLQIFFNRLIVYIEYGI